jgi:hypothetical protein
MANSGFPNGGEGRPDWRRSARYTVMQAHFLDRLERLLRLRNAADSRLEPWQARLLVRAIYSTYRDCLELGLADQARSILHGEESAPQSSAST